MGLELSDGSEKSRAERIEGIEQECRSEKYKTSTRSRTIAVGDLEQKQ